MDERVQCTQYNGSYRRSETGVAARLFGAVLVWALAWTALRSDAYAEGW